MPKDTLQIFAAKELHNRDWRYDKELKLWFTRDRNDPGPEGNGSYIYFDIDNWERRPVRESSVQGGFKFMTEEEHGML